MANFVLIVEDEAVLGKNMGTFLRHLGYQTELVISIAAARRAYHELHPDIILLDHNLPDGTGLSFIDEVRKEDRWTKIVMITAHGNVGLAVNAMKNGADDYITKPAPLDEIGIVVGRLAQQARAEGSLKYLQGREKSESGLSRIIGDSVAITELKRRIKFLTSAELAAARHSPEPGLPVLILGETGTGKELVARALHFDGPRADKPFISINCAALPEQLVESELFGHEKGAFSGATEKKIGLFQAAEAGTIFLDEVGELPLTQQAKLLRAIEDRVIRPVGSTRDRPIDVRFIAATNVELERKAQCNEFRADLFYRLNTIQVYTPALRDRAEDVLTTAQHFMLQSQKRYGRSGLYLGDDAQAALLTHPWPGNVRELRNVIEQAVLLCAGPRITLRDMNLRAPQRAMEATPGPRESFGDQGGLIESEKKLIISALREMQGNVTLAAQALGISRDTLRYRMEKYALDRSHYRMQA